MLNDNGLTGAPRRDCLECLFKGPSADKTEEITSEGASRLNHKCSVHHP